MNISIDESWEAFVEKAVRDGRYGSASDVVGEGLRLVAERDAKRVALREMLDRSIAQGGAFDDAEIDAALADRAFDLARQGF